METKICCNCGKSKATAEFNKRKASKDGLQPRCKECHALHNKIHYRNNKDRYIERSIKFKQELVDWYNKLKQERVCENCGEARSWCLEYHHPDPTKKDGGVSQFVYNHASRRVIIEEIEKCQVLCRNCHADVHHKMRQKQQASSSNGRAAVS